MPAPPHVVQTLADIDALRARLNDTERTLRTIYALPEPSEVPSPAPPADTVPVAPARVARGPRKPKDSDDRVVGDSPSTGSKYDEGILRYLKSEPAQHGASLMDVARSFTGPGKPTEAQKLTSAMFSALASLVKRGQVRKDGRYYHIVRAHERDEVTS